MKPFLPVLLRMLAGTVAGFAVAAFFVKTLVKPSPRTEATSPGTSVSEITGKTAPDSAASPMALPPAGDFQRMDVEAKLAFAARLRNLSPEQRETLLKECGERTDPERTLLLSLVLSEWAETDPAAASDSALSHLDQTGVRCFHDIAQIWAARDGKGFADWSNRALLNKDRYPFSGAIRTQTLYGLERYDPVSRATFLEMEGNRDFIGVGSDCSSSLRTPEAVKDMSARLKGHVAYIDDLNELRRQHTGESRSQSHIPTKNGWNELFEQTAIAWHRMNPAECDAWLSTWPENAQLVARNFIDSTESQSKNKANPAPEPPTTATASELGQTAHSESSGIVPPAQRHSSQPPSLPDAAAPASGTADRQVEAWKQWWRGDAAAAEAFLNTATWPQDLKFRARAQAYSSAP